MFHDSEVATYDQPGLQFSGISGLAVAGTPLSSFFIQVHLQTYYFPVPAKQYTPQQMIPNIVGGLAYGGSVLTGAGTQFPKIQAEGYIDVDMVSDTELAPYAGEAVQVSNVTVNSIPMHWIDVIAMFFEGRYNGAKYDPTYWRDAYGRVYNNPTIFDYTGTYIAGTPQRANFTMTLALKNNTL